MPIAYCLLPIAYCLLPIAYCLLPIAFCLLPFALKGKTMSLTFYDNLYNQLKCLFAVLTALMT
ncbi:hypothetical protein [Moorena sp. SIO4G3]|uniref:hypothetical protein n=1 Tax=Moorena sp. SIO4G3 TaxID=2607821 RepID=UPI001429DDA4|nr:hypothetical protein [Moorena sp. SIO4G3]NEO75726.1 hypothetical protein [Moorena sp. SIO4G3]